MSKGYVSLLLDGKHMKPQAEARGTVALESVNKESWFMLSCSCSNSLSRSVCISANHSGSAL